MTARRAYREFLLELKKTRRALVAQIVTMQEAADRMSLGLTTLKSLVRRGVILPVNPTGKRLMIPVKEIERLATPRPSDSRPARKKHRGASAAERGERIRAALKN